MKVLIYVPDSVGPDLDRLRALVGDTAMVMRAVGEGVVDSTSDPEKIVNHFNISVDGHGRLIVYGVVDDEDEDDLLGSYAVIRRWPRRPK